MSIPRITAAQAARLFDGGKATPVDVRQPDEFAGGHVAGAINLPLEEIEARAAQVLPNRAAPLVVYCRSGVRSAMAAVKLESMGYTALLDMGGVMYWPYELEYT